MTSRVCRVATSTTPSSRGYRDMAGRKKVEFRERPLALDVSTVIVYGTHPVEL